MVGRVARVLVSASLAALAVTGTGGVAAAAGAGVAGASTPGAAQASLASQKAVLERVVNASDHVAAYKALSTSDQAVFRQALTHQTAVVTEGPVTAASPSPGAGSGGTTSPLVATSAVSGCWQVNLDIEWYDLGINDGETWNRLNWCAANGSVTSYYLNNIGGRGKAGQTYDGVEGNYYLNVGWEVRAVTEYHFSYTGVPWSDVYPCNQIRGGATGLYSTPGADGGHGGDCNLN
jgi:hypothetical protein